MWIYRSIFLASYLLQSIEASPIWPSSLGIMQSNIVGSNSPVDILYSFTSPPGNGEPRGLTTLIGVTSSELAVVLFQAVDDETNQQTQLSVYKNDQVMWTQPIGLNCMYITSCNLSIAFDDAVIYATTVTNSDGDQRQYGCIIFNVTTGAQIYVQPYNNILPVFSGQTLPVIASSSDSPLSQPASFVWISSDNVVFVGEFSPTLGLNGTNATLPVVFADKGCALAHNDLAVCLLASGGIAVLKAHSPTNPSILWTNYVKPLYIAKDIGPSGILVVDTDVGGFNGGVIAGLELMTGEALWTWAKPPTTTYTAYAYNSAGTMMLKSFGYIGAEFSASFDTFSVTATKIERVSTASIPSFPPSSLPFEDFLSFDANGVTAYTCNSLGGDVSVLAITSGTNGAGAFSTLITDSDLQASALVVAGPKPTQISVQYNPFTINILM
jgi:hypothetical protein